MNNMKMTTYDELSTSIKAYDPSSNFIPLQTTEDPSIGGWWFTDYTSENELPEPTIEQLESIYETLVKAGVFQTHETALASFLALAQTECFKKVIASQVLDPTIMVMAHTAIAAMLVALYTKNPSYSEMSRSSWVAFVNYSKTKDSITGITPKDREDFNNLANSLEVPEHIRT